MDLHNQRVWITGASSGIGRALAQQLAEQGAQLILSARREQPLMAVLDSLPNPERHRLLLADLAQPQQCDAYVKQALGFWGGIDILINNAGVAQAALAEDTCAEVDRQLMEVNFFAPVALSKALLPDMLQRRSGMIVNISSVAGLVGTQTRSTYSAAKHALLGFMDSLRSEVHRRGVRVVNICPGWVSTNISMNALKGCGSALGFTDPVVAAGISAETCARAIVKSIKTQRRHLVVGRGVSRWAPLVKRFCPSLVYWLAGRKVYR